MPTSPGPKRIGIQTVKPVSLVNPDPVAGQIAYDRVLWFADEGPPPSASSIGAKPGDMYLNTLTDDVYLLED